MRTIFYVIAAALALATSAQATDDLSKPIAASPGGHFLVRPDGKPFFWLADTAWTIFARLTREEADFYLRDRAAKGFNVIQGVAAGQQIAGQTINGLENANRYGELPLIDKDPARPNPRYFEHIDWVIERAASHGIRIALLPIWGASQIGLDPMLFNETTARSYGRWIAHRYRDKGIIWVLGGDIGPIISAKPGEKDAFVSVIDRRPIYDAMAEGINEGSTTEPFITYHPSPVSVSGIARPRTSLYFHDRPWLDMNMLHSSHFSDGMAWLERTGIKADFIFTGPRNYEPVRAEYDSMPIRPIVDGEARFEDLAVDLDENAAKGYWSGYEARNAAYHAVFAGAAGHTYGNHSIWQFYDADQKAYELPRAELKWREALQRPVSGQLHHLKTLMLSRPYFTRAPDQSLIVGDAGEGSAHIGATRDRDGAYAFIYVPHGQTVKVDLTKLSGSRVVARWYDPRTGEASKIPGIFDNRGTQTFSPPANGPESDWVLVLDDASRAFPAPGKSRAH